MTIVGGAQFSKFYLLTSTFYFQAKKKAVADGGMSLEQRKARDAEIMRLKQEKKLEEAAAKAAPPPKKWWHAQIFVNKSNSLNSCFNLEP